MEKLEYVAPTVEEAGSFEDVTLAVQGGGVIDQGFINAIQNIQIGDPIPTGAFS